MATTARLHPLDRLSLGGDPGARRAAPVGQGPGVHDRAGSWVHGLRRREVLAWGFTFAGMLTVGFGWYGISGEANTWRQLPYLLSGGVGGASLVAVGVALLVSSEHGRDRDALELVLDRLDSIEYELVEHATTPVLSQARHPARTREPATAGARARGVRGDDQDGARGQARLPARGPAASRNGTATRVKRGDGRGDGRGAG